MYGSWLCENSKAPHKRERRPRRWSASQRGRCTSVTGPVPGQPGEVGLVPHLATLLSRLDGSSMSGLPGKQTVNMIPCPATLSLSAT